MKQILKCENNFFCKKMLIKTIISAIISTLIRFNVTKGGRMRNFRRIISIILILAFVLPILSCGKNKISLNNVPEYSGSPYVEINGGEPFFTKKERKSAEAFERYAELDPLGRCGAAFACLGPETLSDEDRESIANVTPTGWEYNGISNNNTYDFVEDNYVYNRCHLIGHQLAGENDNEKNLITGTRYMNIEGMLPFENMIAEYIRQTSNHVLYRVTPIFKGLDYVARGVLMEAYSIEDSGRGIKICIYLYNVQPGVDIDYFTGVNMVEGSTPPDYSNAGKEDNSNDNTDIGTGEIMQYILNVSSKKFHTPGGYCAGNISDKNRKEYEGTREALIADGYTPCGICKP